MDIWGIPVMDYSDADDFESFHIGSVTGRKAKPKPKQDAPECWFETLTMEQLGELCVASKIGTSGTKKELIDRLLDSATKEFATVGRAKRIYISRTSCSLSWVGGRPGHNTAALKELCEKEGLRSSGDRFELVVRIVRHRSGLDTGPPPKKVRVVGPSGMLEPAKPRLARDMDKIEERARAWCTQDKSKWSNQRWKNHGGDVLSKAYSLLKANSSDTASHGLVVARAIFKGIASGASSIATWGYGNARWNASELGRVVMKLVAASDMSAAEVRCVWISCDMIMSSMLPCLVAPL